MRIYFVDNHTQNVQSLKHEKILKYSVKITYDFRGVTIGIKTDFSSEAHEDQKRAGKKKKRLQR